MDSASVAPRLMPLHILEEITDGFSEDRKLGAGSYGNVFTSFLHVTKDRGFWLVKALWRRRNTNDKKCYRNTVHENWKTRLHATSHSEQVKRCIEIALSCVEADRHKRPSIGVIINKLNETESISKLNESESTNSRKHIEPYKMCSCISTLLDIELNNLFAYTMPVIGQSGRKHEVTIMTACQPSDSTTTFKFSWSFRHTNLNLTYASQKLVHQ